MTSPTPIPTSTEVGCPHSSCKQDINFRTCHCDDQCRLYRDCCVDAEPIPFLNNRTQSHLYKLLACERTNFESSQVMNINQAHLMVSSCPQEWQTTQQNSQRAEQIVLHCTNASLFLPITDPHTNFTFRNIYCALCNNISQNQVVHWEPQFSCDYNTTLELKTRSNYTLAEIVEQCTLTRYFTTLNNAVRGCLPHVSSCPHGNRSDQEYNRFVDDCMSEDINLHYEPTEFDLMYAKLFRNKFCAECNGVNNSMCFYTHLTSNVIRPGT